MKIKKTRVIEEEIEIKVDFPFFRKERESYIGIYSESKGFMIEYSPFYDKFHIETLTQGAVLFHIENDSNNLQMGYSPISKELFEEMLNCFLKRIHNISDYILMVSFI